MSLQPAQRGSLDIANLIAVACVVVSWFWLETLVTDVGRFEFSFRFYDVWTLINNPGLLLIGIGDTRSLGATLFGVLCAIAAVLPLSVLLRDTTATRLSALAPLLVMVIFGGLLYLIAATNIFSTDADANSLGGQLAGLANSITNTLLGKIADRVTPGIGAWLGLLASVFLAVRRLAIGVVR